MPQTTMQLDPNRGMEGSLDEGAPHFRESCVCDETLGIPFGRAVRLKSISGTSKLVDLVAGLTEAAAPYGVAGRNPVEDTNGGLYDDGDGLTVVREGIVTVKVEDAVTAGSQAFVRGVAGASLTALGRFRSDDGDEGSGPLASALPMSEYLDSGSAGEYCRLWLGSPNREKQKVVVTFDIPDVSTGDEVYVAAPVSGRVVLVQSCLDAAISGADANITFEIDGTPIVGAALVVAQSGSAAGDVDSAVPTDTNVVTAGQTLSAVTDGASTGAVRLRCTIVIEKD